MYTYKSNTLYFDFAMPVWFIVKNVIILSLL